METRLQSLPLDIFLPRKSWTPNHLAHRCFSCGSSFTFMNRRHHCRMCGNIFDKKCSNYFLSPPAFVFAKEKKIRVCCSCFEKTDFLFQEKESTPNHMDSCKRVQIDNYLMQFLTDKFHQQAEKVLTYYLQENHLFEDWFEILNPLVKESIELVKPNVLENGYHNINDFVKIKKLLSSPKNSAHLMKGLVIRKNVTHKKMVTNVNSPTILMIKGNLEPYNRDEISVLDSNSDDYEVLYLKSVANQLKKLNPSIIVVEGTVNRTIQDMILKANKVLVMKLRNSQFRKVARYTGAKPIQDLISADRNDHTLLGECCNFSIQKLQNTDILKEGSIIGQNGQLIEPSIMLFDGCDPTRGVSLVLNGPDYETLFKVKQCLKKVLVLVRNLYFERAIIYQDIMLYHMKERLCKILTVPKFTFNDFVEKQDFRDKLTILNPSNPNENPETSPPTCLFNKNTYFSAGFTSHYLTEKNPIEYVVKNSSLTFTKIILIPINMNYFPDLVKRGIDVETQLLPSLKASKRWHTNEVCQLEKEPVVMTLKFHDKDDASLGLYMFSKASCVFEKCIDCNRSYYYHTTIFFIRKFYIKITLELKNQAKLKQIEDSSKKIKPKNESSKSSRIGPNEGFIDFLGKVAPPRRQLEALSPQMKLSTINNLPSNENTVTPFDVIMYIECSQCQARLSDLVKLKQEFLDYSFTRYLENLAFTAEQYHVSVDTYLNQIFDNNQKDVVEPLSKVPDKLKDVPKKVPKQSCCLNSFKNRVFMVEDLYIRFKVGFSNPYDLSVLSLKSPQATESVNQLKKELLKMKQQQLKDLVTEYFEMTISNIREVIRKISETYNVQLTIDNIALLESFLHDLGDVSDREPHFILLLGLICLLKDILNYIKEMEMEMNKECIHHLEVDLRRKAIFNKIMKFFTSLDKVKKDYNKAQDKKISNPKEKTQSKQLISIAESTKSVDDHMVDPDSSKLYPSSRTNTLDEYMFANSFRKGPLKQSLTEEEKTNDEETDKEKTLIDKFSKGLINEINCEQGTRKFEMLPISEEETLSIIAYTMNSPLYLEECYQKEGFGDVIIGDLKEEDSKENEILRDFLANKVLQTQTEENLQKQFIFKVPNLEAKRKFFNRLLFSLIENNEPSVKSKQAEGAQDITLFGERFDIVNQKMKLKYSQAKFMWSKTTVIVHYPVQFEILRLYNGIDLKSYLDSLSTSQNWKNDGGKTGSPFIKTFDQRFVFKQLEKKEFGMLLGFVNNYFKYMFKVCKEEKPSLLSKIYGIYEIVDDKKSVPMYFIAMENIFFGMDDKIKIYDLKGSELGRYSERKPDEGKTLWDTDYKIERNGEPLPLKSKYYDYVYRAVESDTDFLESLEVVDYSLLLIMDESKSLVRMGIIDYLRIYDLEKQIEHVGKKLIKGVDPTIVKFDKYKDRFQKAVKKYFMSIHSD